jgi:hypothetical protein
LATHVSFAAVEALAAALLERDSLNPLELASIIRKSR